LFHLVRFRHAISILERQNFFHSVFFVDDMRALAAPFAKSQVLPQKAEFPEAYPARFGFPLVFIIRRQRRLGVSLMIGNILGNLGNIFHKTKYGLLR